MRQFPEQNFAFAGDDFDDTQVRGVSMLDEADGSVVGSCSGHAVQVQRAGSTRFTGTEFLPRGTVEPRGRGVDPNLRCLRTNFWLGGSRFLRRRGSRRRRFGLDGKPGFSRQQF